MKNQLKLFVNIVFLYKSQPLCFYLAYIFYLNIYLSYLYQFCLRNNLTYYFLFPKSFYEDYYIFIKLYVKINLL